MGVYRPRKGGNGNLPGQEALLDEELEYREWWGGNVDREDIDLRDELNAKYQPDYLEARRFQMKPERAFGALFELEGVLVRTMTAHEQSWRQLAEEEKYPNYIVPTEWRRGDYEKLVTIRNEQFIYEVLAWTRDPYEIMRLSKRKDEIYGDILEKHGIEKTPGALHLLQLLKEAEVPCAVGALVHHSTVDKVLELAGMNSYFQSVVGAEDFLRPKPSPHMFLVMAEGIARPPVKCAVFEHSPIGIEAARAALMKVVCIGTSHTPYQLTGADVIVDNWNDFSVMNLKKMFVILSS
eukprot:CAMPEP_0184647114 /NCGR_PEP_ID=MMETSP0308-20130426/4020_1 /TAXON_ID=38269 /ORGANISM="Gloeochaete witrockiana, Strain SAG 46.84" /LENGTH=293 /DNA_ID=CAMNT_0027077857 /DNA_START=283 /DNA_END=1164 /DNA_ORIENTATION=-